VLKKTRYRWLRNRRNLTAKQREDLAWLTHRPRTSRGWRRSIGTQILAWHRSRISNGLLEGTNSLIQAAKARARGFRSKQKVITIVYLLAGRLPKPSLSGTPHDVAKNRVLPRRGHARPDRQPGPAQHRGQAGADPGAAVTLSALRAVS
jgi:hypothetical protein